MSSELLLIYALKLHITHPCTWLIDRLTLPKTSQTFQSILMKLFLQSKADIILLGPRGLLIVVGKLHVRISPRAHASVTLKRKTLPNHASRTHLLPIRCSISKTRAIISRQMITWHRLFITSHYRLLNHGRVKLSPSDIGILHKFARWSFFSDSHRNETYSNERFLAGYGGFGN